MTKRTLTQVQRMLQGTYRAGLHDKIATLTAAADALGRGEADADVAAAADAIRQLAHQLVGSGTSYGLPAISAAAAAAEQADDDALPAEVATLIATLRAHAS